MKWGVLGLLVCGLLIIPLVSAAELPAIGTIVVKIGESLRDIFSPILSVLLNYEAGGAFFGARIIAGLALFIILYVVVGKIPSFNENRLIVFLLSLIPTLLILRYTTDEQFQALLFPTTALGTILAITVIPIGIFVALHYMQASPIVRRIVLGVVLLVYVVYAVHGWDTFPEDIQMIYIGAFVLFIVFLLFDSGIHAWFDKAGMNTFLRASRDAQIADIQRQIMALSSVAVQTTEITNTIKRLKKQMAELHSKTY